MRIVVYGSASKDTPQAFRDASFELGKQMAQRGHICVNGGGNTGCMGSLSDGCLQNGGKVVGVIHEMFVVDGEEHTGVSEMLVFICMCMWEDGWVDGWCSDGYFAKFARCSFVLILFPEPFI